MSTPDPDHGLAERHPQQAHPGGVVDVTCHPGENPPHEYHAYIIAPEVSAHPIFACVLMPGDPDEGSPDFQPVLGRPTDDALAGALGSWAARLWPGLPVPEFRVRHHADMPAPDRTPTTLRIMGNLPREALVRMLEAAVANGTLAEYDIGSDGIILLWGPAPDTTETP